MLGAGTALDIGSAGAVERLYRVEDGGNRPLAGDVQPEPVTLGRDGQPRRSQGCEEQGSGRREVATHIRSSALVRGRNRGQRKMLRQFVDVTGLWNLQSARLLCPMWAGIRLCVSRREIIWVGNTDSRPSLLPWARKFRKNGGGQSIPLRITDRRRSLRRSGKGFRVLNEGTGVPSSSPSVRASERIGTRAVGSAEL